MARIIEIGEQFDTPGNAATGVIALVQDEWTFEEMRDLQQRIYFPIHQHMTNQTFIYGNVQYSFVDDFYYRIYLFPPVIDFGVVVTNKIAVGTVWNAYLNPVVMTNAVFQFGDEITMSDPARPVGFDALELINFGFTATKLGKPILQDFLYLTFDTGEDDLTWPMVGTRPAPADDLVFPFGPSWDQNYSYLYEYNTDIIESQRGNEQRRQNRQTPRRTTSFTAQLQNNSDRRKFNSLMTRQTSRFFIPELPRYVSTTSAMGPAGLTLDVDELPWWIVIGAYVMLNDGSKYGVRQIDSVVGNTLTFNSSDVTDWAEGVKLHPALLGWWGDEFTTQQLTNWVSTVDVQHKGTPASEVPLPVTAIPQTFDGRELFLTNPNWGVAPNVDKVWPREFMDFTVGRIESLLSREFGKTRITMSFNCASIEEHDELFFFFVRMAGRCGEFYMPSWASDLELAEDVIETENRLQVVGGDDFLNAYNDDTTRSAIAILTNDGDVTFLPISDVFGLEDSNSAGEPTVYLQSLSDTWGVSIDNNDIDKVMWVSLYRFSTDQLTVTWLTDGVCTMNFTVEELERCRPDTDTIEDSNS